MWDCSGERERQVQRLSINCLHKGKVKFSLYLINHHAIKTYGSGSMASRICTEARYRSYVPAALLFGIHWTEEKVCPWPSLDGVFNGIILYFYGE
jgi:hypothetical protein